MATLTGKTISQLPQITVINPNSLFVVEDHGITYNVPYSGLTNSTNSGLSGLSGELGESGISGLEGSSGISGEYGISGLSGLEGISGELGHQGDSGLSGLSGLSGDSGLSGINGDSGLSGLEGISGLSGLEGISGLSGLSGDSGLSGISGDSGLSGISGDSGFSGLSGESGISGLSGDSGLSGISGDSGLSGNSGLEGLSGNSGLSGLSGESGISGLSGISGDSGLYGLSGDSGLSGISGDSGLSGDSGISGLSGIPGSGATFSVLENAGLKNDSGVLSTTYNTLLDSALSMASTVGGISAGTTVSNLSGKTFVQLFDDLLFPTVLPTYTIPTITLNGVSTQTLEVGSTFSGNLSAYGIKNDAGPYTQIRLIRNGSVLSTYTGLTVSSESNVPNQFGYNNPNNPNFRYTISPTPYSESYVIPAPAGANTSTSSTYASDGNYNAGLTKQNNKNVTDTRPAQVRSTNAPQAAGTNYQTSTFTLTGIYPYFWGTSATLPTANSIAAAISGGTANKVLSSASGTLSIPYNVSGQYIWVAYFNQYTTKTKWYVNALDNGNIDNSFITTAVTQAVNSPNGFWSNVSFKMHWSVNATIQSTLEFRNN